MTFFKRFFCLLLLAVPGFSQIAKYGTGNPPEFSFTLQSTFRIFHNLKTQRIIVACYHTPVRTEFVKGTDYSTTVVDDNSVSITFVTPPQSGVCIVNGGIGIGIQGIAGTQGIAGPQGVSVTGTSIDVSGNLIITMSNGTTTNAGFVKGSPGANGHDGISITGTAISNGHLIITKSDSSSTDVGVVMGPAGPTGPQGPPGPAGSAPSWRGPWDSGTNYSQSDTVSYLGTSYIALGSSLNKAPDANPALWAVTAAKGDTGPSGPAGAPGTGITTLGFAFSNQSTVSIVHNYGTVNIVWACYTPSGILIEGGTYSNTDSNNSVVNFLGNQTGYCVPNGGIGPPGAQGPQGVPGVGAGITQLTNDVTTPASSSGSTVATLKTVNSNVGTLGDATHTVRATYDAKGRVTSAVEVPIAFPGGTGSSFYQTILTDGTPVSNQRAKLNFIGSGVTISAADNGTDTTSLTFTVSGGGGGSGINNGALTRIGVGGDLASCSAGDAFVATDQLDGQSLYLCNASGWYQYNTLSGDGLKYTSGSLGIDTTVVPRLAGNNTFSGLFTLSSATAPASSHTNYACFNDQKQLISSATPCNP